MAAARGATPAGGSAARRYRIEFTQAGNRSFRSLPADVQRRLRPHIDALAGNPRPQGSVVLRGEEGFLRLRVGDYRIVYEVRDRVLLILIIRIGHRRDVYRKDT